MTTVASKDIFGWCDFEDIYREQVERAKRTVYPLRFVEVGAFMGKSAVLMAELLQEAGIGPNRVWFDVWDDWSGVPAAYQPRNCPPAAQLEATCREHLQPYIISGQVLLRTGDTFVAADYYPDEWVDFLFLDDCHEEDHVRNECAAWWPKLAQGGIMAGHDHDWPSVKVGVEAWAMKAGVVVEPTSKVCWKVRKP